MKQISVELITPDGDYYNESALSIIIPLLDGLAGIMYNHSPMIAKLSDGFITGKNIYNRNFSYLITSIPAPIIPRMWERAPQRLHINPVAFG